MRPESWLAVELAEFVAEPTRHPLYRPSADGKDVVLPRGLSRCQFEEWRWKQRPDVDEDEDWDEDEDDLGYTRYAERWLGSGFGV